MNHDVLSDDVLRRPERLQESWVMFNYTNRFYEIFHCHDATATLRDSDSYSQHLSSHYSCVLLIVQLYL